MVDVNAVIESARSWVGVPFRHCGRNRFGVDCVGLVLVVARDCGVTYYEPPPYARLVDPAKMLTELQTVCERLPEPVPGAILLLKSGGVAQHLGICTGSTLIHAYEPANRVAEVGYTEYWQSRTEAAFQWRQ